MRRTTGIAAGGVALAFTLAGSFAAYPGDGKAPANAAVGELAPEIEVREWINGDGRTSLADFRGEVVLLEFWGTH